MVMLMLIGGAPGSTAGGMKMTTIAVYCFQRRLYFAEKKTPSVLADVFQRKPCGMRQ